MISLLENEIWNPCSGSSVVRIWLCTIAGLFKKPLFVRTRFHLVIFMLMIFISFDTISSITVSRPCWIGCWELFHPNTWCPRGEGMYGWAVSTSNSSPIFYLNKYCAPTQNQWLSVVQRGFMKGTRNPLRFCCLLLDDF